jgi:hypothetical protein
MLTDLVRRLHNSEERSRHELTLNQTGNETNLRLRVSKDGIEYHNTGHILLTVLDGCGARPNQHLMNIQSPPISLPGLAAGK